MKRLRASGGSQHLCESNFWLVPSLIRMYAGDFGLRTLIHDLHGSDCKRPPPLGDGLNAGTSAARPLWGAS